MLDVLLLASLGACAGAQALEPLRGASHPDPAPHPDLAGRAESMDRLLAPWNRPNQPGAAVIVIRDGQVLHSSGYGIADLRTDRRFRPDTVSMIGSLTKQFTATAILVLMEEGRLTLDDPLTKFFDQVPPGGGAIRLRHLLDHTSGLPVFEDFLATREASGLDARDTVETYLRRSAALRFEPGDKWEYSNGAFVVLSQVIERVSGQRYPEFMRRRIFEPLGMAHTYFADDPRVEASPRAVGYFREFYGLKVSETLPSMKRFVGAGSLFSTAEDLARWDAALYTDSPVKRATHAVAWTPASLNDGTRLMYAAGWEVYRHKGVPYMIHPGGWGGFKSFMLRFPNQQFTVIALSNSGQFDIATLPLAMARIYLGGEISIPPKIVTWD